MAGHPAGDGAPGAGTLRAPPAGFDYELPPDRIAQDPPERREDARLLVVPRGGGDEDAPVDSSVRELPRFLRPGDLLVLNRSRVVKARLRGRRDPEGGAVELLLVAPDAALPAAGERWSALARPARRLRAGRRIALLAPGGGEVGVALTVVGSGDGRITIEFPPDVEVLDLAERIGEPPLPPYIRRPEGVRASDAERYQTVFAAEPGSIAAPTAGLHLTKDLLAAIGRAGIGVAEVVLHVGPATFLAGRPGRATLAVEPERCLVPPETRAAIEEARRSGGRVVAVGTTTTRALESESRAGWPGRWRETSLVLAPGSRFEVVDALLTNFHLPGSSLLALVSAFAGTPAARTAYRAALERGYRFYSYGDAMLIA